MNTVVLQQGMGIPITSAGIRLLGLPAEKSAKKQLTGSADEVVKTIASILDQMIMGAIDKCTAEEFRAARDEALPSYIQLVVSLAGIVSAIVPAQALSRLTSESFSELEADIRDHALAAVGADMRDRAMFTVWTLRKIADLLSVIAAAGKVPEEDGKRDKEFFSLFLAHALMARFNIDCLRAAMRSGRTIYPDVLPVMDSGLRSVVDAYSWIRQAAELRSGSDEIPCGPATWDAEDDQLLRESEFDLAHEPI